MTGGGAKVHLVGAGPGDPELLTVKAARLLEQADVLVYDRLVGAGVLDLVPPGAARFYVGKESGAHHVRQDEINDLLVRVARPGRTVVRLKGGDPFIFGRGYEEVEALLAAGIAVEVTPGITSASGCAAAAGIPLTHRGVATGVRFITGHVRAEAPLEHNWANLADPDTTLVVYMGLGRLADITQHLIGSGLRADTPAAAIERGTMPEQRVCRSQLSRLDQDVATARLRSPVLIVIGHVVGLMQPLAPALPLGQACGGEPAT